MSRSYRKTPKIKYCGDGKRAKRRANKLVRRQLAMQTNKGNHYRKWFPTWDITDVRSYCKEPGKDNLEDYRFWEKVYKRK